MDRLAVIIGFLAIATALESGGDALVRMGLQSGSTTARAGFYVAGAALLFGYALTLNLAPLPFGRVVGLYVAIFFIVFQIVNFVAFRTMPTLPILAGGALIVVGGAIVSLWEG